MANPTNNWSTPNGDEQAPAAGVGRRMLLPGRVRLAASRGTGEGVVVAVGAGPGVAEHPSQPRTLGDAREHAGVEGGRQMVTGDLVDAFCLPLPVGRAQAVRRVVSVGRLPCGGERASD